MLRSWLLVASFILVPELAWTQEGGLSSSKPAPKIVNDTGPVTCNEAHNVLDQVQSAMMRALLMKSRLLIKIAPSNKPVARVQILDEFDRFERQFQPYYTLKPRTQYCNAAVVKFTGPERQKAIRLIKLGFLEPVAPMVTGPAGTLTVAQFSEAVGFFIERWSDMTHLPSVKWSPDLQRQTPTQKPPGAPGGPVPSGASRQQASS